MDMKNFVYIIILFITILFGCKKEQPKMKPLLEDCSCANEVSADFLMEEQAHNNPNLPNLYTNTDTIHAYSYVRFTALEKNATYKWYAGTEEITDEQFVRFFPTDLEGMNLPLVLVVKKKPNLLCFPNDDGYDSIVKYLHVAPQYDIWSGYHPLEGTYRFFAPHKNDSIDVVFDVYAPLGMSNMFDLMNFDGEGNNSSFNNFQSKFTYRELMQFEVGNTVYGGYLFSIRKNMDGSVHFKLEGRGTNTHHFEYKGRKL